MKLNYGVDLSSKMLLKFVDMNVIKTHRSIVITSHRQERTRMITLQFFQHEWAFVYCIYAAEMAPRLYTKVDMNRVADVSVPLKHTLKPLAINIEKKKENKQSLYEQIIMPSLTISVPLCK